MEVGGVHAHRAIAKLHCVAPSPKEQPFQLTVAKQSVCVEVPDKKSSEHITHTHLSVCFLTPTAKFGILDHLTDQLTALQSVSPLI